MINKQVPNPHGKLDDFPEQDVHDTARLRREGGQPSDPTSDGLPNTNVESFIVTAEGREKK